MIYSFYFTVSHKGSIALKEVSGGRLSEEEILARQQFIAAKGASEASAEDKALAGADPAKATAAIGTLKKCNKA